IVRSKAREFRGMKRTSVRCNDETICSNTGTGGFLRRHYFTSSAWDGLSHQNRTKLPPAENLLNYAKKAEGTRFF
ncbi:MAG: hypothetical protein ABR523_05945, partial [Desulfurivibrionaceae bacterium]